MESVWSGIRCERGRGGGSSQGKRFYKDVSSDRVIDDTVKVCIPITRIHCLKPDTTGQSARAPLSSAVVLLV